MRHCGTKCQKALIAFGIALFTIGYLLHVYWVTLLDAFLQKAFTVSTSSKTYDSWIKAKVPVYCSFYFFNWTNPSDFNQPDYKPKLEEVGPYVFLQTLEKVDVVFHNNGTVSYKLKRYWYFDREKSVGPLTDKITSTNPVIASVKYKMRNSFSMSTLTRIAAPDGFFSKSVRTVDELLFTGYKDRLIDLGRLSQIFFSGVNDIPYDRFGWLYPKNGSISEAYTMETGENGMDVFGELTAWDLKKNTEAYSGSCGDVLGSGGNFWPWNVKKGETTAVFSGDICRSITLYFTEELSYGGLPAYRFDSGADFVDNGTLDSRNKCLCTGECVPVGAFNASICGKGAPVFISYPHFRHGDPYYTNSVEGMHPEVDRTGIYVILDPKYGVPLEFSASIQINLLVEFPRNTLKWGESKRKRIFFPVMWMEQSFKIMQKDLETMKLLNKLPEIGFIVSVIFMVTGPILLIISLVLHVLHKNQKYMQKRRDGSLFL